MAQLQRRQQELDKKENELNDMIESMSSRENELLKVLQVNVPMSYISKGREICPSGYRTAQEGKYYYK